MTRSPFEITKASEVREILGRHTITTALPREEVERRLNALAPWRYRLRFSNGADTATMPRMNPWVEDIHEKIAVIWPWVSGALSPGFSALDVGCGPAHHRFSLRALGCGRYTGIEPHERNVRLAEAVLECAGETFVEDNIIHADAAEAHPQGPFDLVVCLAVMNNMDNIYGGLRTVRNAMGPSSILVLENLITERVAGDGAFVEFMPDGYMSDNTLRWIPTLSGLEGLLRHFGFEGIEHKFHWTNTSAIGDGMAKVMTVARIH
jgi:SAM-dependent methyltransferase